MGLKEDKLKTIEYAKSYGCNLNEVQIWERLIGSVPRVIATPQRRGKQSRRDHHVVRQRRTPRDDTYFNKIQLAQKLADLLGKRFQNILFIGVTGSVAAEFPKKNDDIDLFIIVRNNTLWITRFWVRVYVFLNKIPHRKFGKKEKKDEVCFNIWLDESVLELPKNRQNLRNAVDLVLMKNVYDRDNTYARFLKANGWAKKFVATPYFHKLQITNSKKQTITNNQITNYKLLNIIYFIFQYLYLKLKCRDDLVDLHRAMWGKGGL